MRYRYSIMIPITHNTIIVPFVLNIAIGIQPRFKTTTALCQNNSLRQVRLSDGTTGYNKTMIYKNMITTTNTIQSSAAHDDDDNYDGDDRDDDNDDAV